MGSWSATFVIVILVCCFPSACRANDAEDEYNLMPPLFRYENVTDCFERYTDGLYCVVKTVVQPNGASEIWRSIEKFSKLPSYHEHALLDRGLCVEACVRILQGLDPSTMSLLDTEHVTLKPYHLLSLSSEKSLVRQHQTRYGKVLNICANYHLWRRYNLTGYSEIERCVTPSSQWPTMDLYHAVFLLIASLLIYMVICATVSDSATPKFRGERIRGSIWLEFSLRRTWSQLVAEPRSALQRDFAFVEVFRVVSAFLILAIHVSMVFTAAPTANMRPLEEFFDQPLARVATSVFPFQVHTFFTISGVMFAVYFLDLAASKGRIGWSLYGQAIVMRYLRIFPTLFMVWLCHASWIDRLPQGPGDYRFFELEKDNCRSNGWLNFLFLNNYFRYSNMCMQQSWHLAADFQFFLIGVPFLMIIHRHPRLTVPLVFSAVTFSMVAPIVNLYHWKLPGVILVNFKQLRFIFYAHPVVQYDYTLSHAHTCSYFSGIFAGMAYHRFRIGSTGSLAGGRMTSILQWGPLVLVFVQAFLAPLFYRLDYSEPILWNAIYGAVHRCCWGAMCAVGILRGATLWRGRHARIYSHPVLLVLSRLSFGVFMVQFFVLKSIARNASGEGIDFSWKIYFESVAYTWIGCYAAAMVLALFVELPFAAISKRVLGSKQRPIENRNKST